MGQITIYLDNEHEQRLRKAAGDAGVPVSRWVASIIAQHTRTVWPASVREAAGSWRDAPDAASIRASEGADALREPI